MKSVKHHSKLIQIVFKSIVSVFIFLVSFAIQSQEVDEALQKEGKKLFKTHCAACHKLDKKLVGPALGNIQDKREHSWLLKWIKNNAELRASGDKDAIAVFEEYNGAPMSAFPNLTDADIDKILYYTKVGDPKTKAQAATVEGAGSGAVKGEAPKWLVWILVAAIVVGILIIANLLKTIAELKGAPKTPGIKGNLLELWEGIKRNTFLQVLFAIFMALITAYYLFGTLFKVGVDQGYQPVQPIAFSHKIHAGDNKIDCQYCHSAAKHSKHSGIPSLGVCMNCHKNISEVAEDTKVVLEDRVLTKPELDKEIAKIYEHVGWDPNELKYTGKTKPIEWIRIHNLPDFAYYNHSQHVNVAGLKCQKCHGPVETMEEVYQYSSLTMGWCIDCHKDTKVDLKGNAYYKKIHEELAKKYGVDQVTIAQLGGKECGKCHY